MARSREEILREIGRLQSGTSSSSTESKDRFSITKALRTGAGFVGNIAKEVVTAIPRAAAAATFAPLTEGIKSLTAGTRFGKAVFPDQSRATTPLSRFAGRGTEPFTKERGGALLGAGVDLAATLVGAPGAASVARSVGKQSLKQLAGQAGKRLLRTVPFDAGFGALGGAAFGIEQGDTEGDLIKDILAGTLLGGAFPAGLAGVGLTTRAVTRGAGDAAGGALTRSTARKNVRLEELRKQIAESPARFKVPETVRREITKTEAQLARIKMIHNLPNTFKRAFIDSEEAIGRLSDQIFEKTGRKVDLRSLVRRSNDIARSTTDNTIKHDIEPIWKDNKGHMDLVLELADVRNKRDRLSSGQVIEFGETAAGLQKRLRAIQEEAALRDVPYEKIINGNDRLQVVMNNMLVDAVQAGTITTKQLNAFRAAHPNYLPNVVKDFVDNPGEFLSNPRKMTTAGELFDKAVGSKRELIDTQKSIIKTLAKRDMQNQQNVTLNRVLSESQLAGLDIFRLVDKDTPSAIDLRKQGLEVVPIRIKGKKEEFIVPREIAEPLKALDPDNVRAVENFLDNTLIGKAFTLPAKTLRAVTTQLSPVFAVIRNPIRDVSTAYLNGRMTPVDWGRTFTGTIFLSVAKRLGIPEEQMPRAARELQQALDLGTKRGAFSGGFFDAEIASERLRKEAMNNKTNIFSRAISVAKDNNPLRVIEEAGDFMEKTTRRAVFIRSMKDTAGDVEFSARMAREATVDFSKAGNVSRVINKVVPFFNARIQGLKSTTEAFNRDPYGFSRRLMYGTAYPALVLNRHNQDYESYQNIPDWERQSFWIIMVGEEEGKDREGNAMKQPLYLKIPKGEAQIIPSAMIDRALNLGRDVYPQETKEFIADLAGAASPIGGGSGAGILSAVLPTTVRIPIELATNYSLFKERPIEGDFIFVPEKNKWVRRDELDPKFRKTTSTSKTAQALGEALGWSPSKIDYVIKQGVLSDILRLIDIPFEDKLQKPLSQPAPENKLWEMAELPFLRSLIGVSDYGAELRKKAAEQKETRDTTTELIERIRKQQSGTEEDAPKPGGRSREEILEAIRKLQQ